MFGLSGNKSSSKSSSNTDVNQNINSGAQSSFDQGYQQDAGMGYGQGGQSGYGYGGGANYGQNVWNPGAQQQMGNNLNNMWGGFQGQQGGMNNMAGQAGGYNQGIAQGSMAPWQGQMQGDAQGRAGQQMNPALMASLQKSLGGPSQMGQMYNSIVGGEGNSYSDPLAAGMNEQSGIMADRMAGGAGTLAGVGAGQSGGSVQKKQEALMRSEMARNNNLDVLGMQERGYDKDLQMKMQIAQNADLGRGQAQDRAIGLMSGGDQNIQQGMQNAPGMQNLGMGMMAPGMQNAAMPFQMAGQYANAMGGPTVLGQGNQFQGGQGNQSNYGYGNQWDQGSGYGQGMSQEDYNQIYNMKSNAKSKGSSFGAGFGM